MLRRFALLAAAALSAAAASTATAAPLALHLALAGNVPVKTACPAGFAAGVDCTAWSGSGSVPGLGSYTAQAVIGISGRAGGGFASSIVGSVTTAKGTLDFRGDNSTDSVGRLDYTVRLSGEGGYASASGSATMLTVIDPKSTAETFIVDGTLDGAALDTTAPALTVTKASAKSLGGGRYAITVAYRASDDSGSVTGMTLTASGSAKPLASGAASGTAKAVVKVKPGTHRLTLKVTVTDASANAASKTVVVKL